MAKDYKVHCQEDLHNMKQWKMIMTSTIDGSEGIQQDPTMLADEVMYNMIDEDIAAVIHKDE